MESVITLLTIITILLAILVLDKILGALGGLIGGFILLIKWVKGKVGAYFDKVV